MSTLAPGVRLGPYEILTPADDGSETCKATDTRDNRTVAISLVPAGLATSGKAHKIAALNHPAIRATFAIELQDGVSFAVMEYLEGETLAARLKRGALGLDESLKTGVALAGALDYAHGAGVVHQDVKPSNVVLTKDGPKLYGFGLANGAEADPRSDVFSFGELLYEMVAGKKAIAKASAELEPLSSVTSVTSPMLEHVVMTCLARNPAERWQTARDLLAELEWISEHSSRTVLAIPVTTRPRRRKLFRVSIVAAAFLVGIVAAGAFFYLRNPQADEFQFLADSVGGNNESFAVSPDGQWIVYNVATGANFNNTPLSIRRVGSITSQTLAGVETNQRIALNNATALPKPFWSPDSRWIGFRQGNKLRKVQVSGGLPVDICDLSYFGGGTWSADGTIVFGSDTGLFRVSDQGGKPEQMTSLDATEQKHLWPYFLPDGRHYLYLAWTGEPSTRTIFAGVLGSKERTRIIAADSNFFYSPPGYLLFRRENGLYAQAFDAQKLAPSGDPVLLTDKVTLNALVTGETLVNFSASQTGVLVYSYGLVLGGGGGRDNQLRQLAWADRTGRVSETPGPEGAYRGVSVSPDGKRIAVHRHDEAGGDIHIIEPGDRVPTRLTFDASRDNSMPVWSPDGMKIVYASHQNGKWGLYQNLSSGSGKEELLFESETVKAPMSWVGKNIVFWVQDTKTSGDIWVLPLDGDKKPIPFANEPANETHAQLSPDGKWLAYTSNKTGNQNQIYVRPFPSGSGIWQVSTNGGDWPRWRQDSKELFYHAFTAATSFTDVEFSVAVSAAGSEFKAAQPEGLFRLPILNAQHVGGDYHTYDVSPDGKRFLYFQANPNTTANTPVATAATTQFTPEPPSGFVVALNWLSQLRK